jgi:catechol-2,3-dioxygenase
MKSHNSKLIEGLRSVSLYVPDLIKAETFYTDIWGLSIVYKDAESTYLAGTGNDHHLIALHKKDGVASVKEVTLRSHSLQALSVIAQLTIDNNGKVLKEPSMEMDPAGGQSIKIQDPNGRIFKIVYGDFRCEIERHEKDCPIRLAHVVMNSHDVNLSQPFLENVLDFSLADRTKIMAFMRCNQDHHSLALADSDNNALNHIAFVMPDLESVMRGGGRMRDAGYPIEWGPGRHGPGDNVFNYFVGPFGVVIEYTSDVKQIDDNYPVGLPQNWGWAPGRSDQWGITMPPSKELKNAQRIIFFQE